VCIAGECQYCTTHPEKPTFGSSKGPAGGGGPPGFDFITRAEWRLCHFSNQGFIQAGPDGLRKGFHVHLCDLGEAGAPWTQPGFRPRRRRRVVLRWNGGECVRHRRGGASSPFSGGSARATVYQWKPGGVRLRNGPVWALRTRRAKHVDGNMRYAGRIGEPGAVFRRRVNWAGCASRGVGAAKHEAGDFVSGGGKGEGGGRREEQSHFYDQLTQTRCT